MRVLYCNCTYAGAVPPEVKHAVLRKLSASGVAFDAVADLCRLSAHEHPLLKRISAENDVRIAACFPRAVRCLFEAAGAPLSEQRADVLNMRTQSPTDVLSRLLLPETSRQKGSAPLADADRFEQIRSLLEAGYDVTSARRAGELAEVDSPKPDGWKPWFPVIDRERCTNCKQCLSFCLFDVFGVDADDQIRVQNPANCKTDCPACSRVCPSVAIIFPKYADSPINGDVVREQDLRRTPVQVDLSALVAPDMQSTLRARNQRARKRFSVELDEPEQLCACRRRQLQQELGIPDEVLANMCAADCAAETSAPEQTNPADQQPAPSEEEWGI